MAEQGEPEGLAPASLSARQWDALGQIRRLEDQGLTAARQVGGLHLATLKPLQTLGLILITEHDERDRKGRKWAAQLTDSGRRATDCGADTH
jgi:hypothetical protein